mgnify:CR=1 FL=1
MYLTHPIGTKVVLDEITVGEAKLGSTIGLAIVPPMGHPLAGWTKCLNCHADARLVPTAKGHRHAAHAIAATAATSGTCCTPLRSPPTISPTANTTASCFLTRHTPRITDTAKRLWVIYVLMTFLQTGLLMLGEMNFFNAFTHSMGTIATGGFSKICGGRSRAKG